MIHKLSALRLSVWLCDNWCIWLCRVLFSALGHFVGVGIQLMVKSALCVFYFKPSANITFLTDYLQIVLGGAIMLLKAIGSPIDKRSFFLIETGSANEVLN